MEPEEGGDDEGIRVLPGLGEIGEPPLRGGGEEDEGEESEGLVAMEPAGWVEEGRGSQASALGGHYGGDGGRWRRDHATAHAAAGGRGLGKLLADGAAGGNIHAVRVGCGGGRGARRGDLQPAGSSGGSGGSSTGRITRLGRGQAIARGNRIGAGRQTAAHRGDRMLLSGDHGKINHGAQDDRKDTKKTDFHIGTHCYSPHSSGPSPGKI